MEIKDLKFVKGSCQQGKPCDIYFYTDVDYWSVEGFLAEFDYIVNYVQPEKINIHINSVGGSCVEGMSVFSKILDCTIPTACYNDGLAASMGSIIWAAGQEVYMKDYALLMIHNPFVQGDCGKEHNQVTDAFTQQLKTIYQKRFCMGEDEIEAIMNGDEGNDGTFFTASQAVEKGFLSADNIITTPEAKRCKVDAVLNGGFDIAKIKAVMNSLCEFENSVSVEAKENNNQNNNNKMKEEITVFAALLNLKGEQATVEGVSAQINELKAQAAKAGELMDSLNEANKKLSETETKLAGSEASVKNLTNDLKKANDALDEYRKAEAETQAKKIDALVEDAINACKIDKEDKETWVKMAENNFALAEEVLSKIPAREDLSTKIADVKDEQEIKNALKSEEEKVQDYVDQVVGKDFQFRTLK